MATQRRATGIAVSLLLGAILLYFAVAACVLHFELSRLLFPRTPRFTGPPAEETFSFKGQSGNEVLVRRHGRADAGCILFFPGQHGATRPYDFNSYTSAGLAVFSLAYPGQDGASGRAELTEIQRLVGDAITAAGSTCPPGRTVFVGVSLGAMLAAYASQSVKPAGLVLLSAAPSLSSAIRVRLRSHLALAPLGLLPLSKLLPHDYSLAESLGRSPGTRVVILQGTHDSQTPIELLREAGVLPHEVHLVEIPGGTHSTTFALSREAQLSTALDMLHAVQ